jgi:hypothetical protein
LTQTRFHIEICRASDAPSVRRFIHEHWKSNHVLSVDDELFRWQHFDQERNRYGFVLARDDNGAIVGLLGFISDRFYRKGPPLGGKAIWLAIWKVLKQAGAPGLGLKLRDFVEAEETPALLGAVGINPRTAPLYRAFGYNVGVMSLYYIVNSSTRQPQLIQGFDGRYDSGTPAFSARSLVPIEPGKLKAFLGEVPLSPDLLPVKDFDYLQGRYISHPTYTYQFYGIKEHDRPLAVLVARRAEANGAYALRVVDFAGPEIALEGIRTGVQALLSEVKAEYVDFYCFGLPAESMNRAGFLRLDPTGPLVVPNYFEPFTSANVQLMLAYRIQGDHRYLAFKGDADQDRPNQLRRTDSQL